MDGLIAERDAESRDDAALQLNALQSIEDLLAMVNGIAIKPFGQEFS